MDLTYVNIIGDMFAMIYQFIFNLSPGYILMLIMLTITAIVVIYFRFFKNLITIPYK